MPDTGKALVRSPTGVLSPPGTIKCTKLSRLQNNLEVESLDSGCGAYCTELLHIQALSEGSDDGIDRCRAWSKK